MEKQVIFIQDQPRGPSILIEVPIAAAAQRVNFPDIQQLRSYAGNVIIIKKLRLIHFEVLANGILTAAANMPIVDLQNSVVTIYAEGWEKGKSIPVLDLNDINDQVSAAGTTVPFRTSQPSFDNWAAVDWPQSYIQFANGQSASVAGVFIFEAEYVKLNANDYKNGIWSEIKGPS